MSKIKELVAHLEEFCNNVVMPQLSIYETEYTKKEEIFDKRINMLKDELSNLPSTNPAEILDPAIYNIEDDDYMTIIEGEEVAD